MWVNIPYMDPVDLVPAGVLGVQPLVFPVCFYLQRKSPFAPRDARFFFCWKKTVQKTKLHIICQVKCVRWVNLRFAWIENGSIKHLYFQNVGVVWW